MLILYFIWTGPCACGRSYQSHSTHVLTMRLIKSRVSRVLRNLDFDRGPLHSTCSLRSIFMYKESSYREGTASYVCLQAIPLWCNLSGDDSLSLNLLGIWCRSYSCFHHLVGDGTICTGIVWVKSSTTRSPLPSWMSWICLVATVGFSKQLGTFGTQSFFTVVSDTTKYITFHTEHWDDSKRLNGLGVFLRRNWHSVNGSLLYIFILCIKCKKTVLEGIAHFSVFFSFF